MRSAGDPIAERYLAVWGNQEPLQAPYDWETSPPPPELSSPPMRPDHDPPDRITAVVIVLLVLGCLFLVGVFGYAAGRASC